MISVIVASHNLKLFSVFKDSLSNTIGVQFELIKIDNIINNYSIFKAYNIGASKAKYEYLVFVHEDVVFYTNNWGLVLLNYFQTLSNPGVFGIAGSSYIPISPSDWWVSDNFYLHMNFLSNCKGGKKGQGILKQTVPQIPKKVYSLDGMFLSMKKSVWKEFPFDDSLLGFHGYDTSICYLISKKYQNYFVPNILVEHFSKGYPNEIWLRNTVLANKTVLGFILQLKIESTFDKSLEIVAYRLFLQQLRKFSSNFSYQFGCAWFYFIPVIRFTMDIRVLFYFLYNSFIYFIQIFKKDLK